MIKWIFAGIGLWLGGFWGAMAGYFIGKFLEKGFSQDDSVEYDTRQRAAYHSPYDGVRRSEMNPRTVFLNALLEMSAHVIAADGRIMHSEMEVMRSFLSQNFDLQTAKACEQRLLTIFQEKKSMSPQQWYSRMTGNSRRVAMILTFEQRLQLMALLAELVKADGRIDTTEVNAMKDVARAIGIDVGVVEQMLSLGSEKSIDDAYSVLGIEPTATDDEVRRAYRKMALQYHPDRVATLGKDVQESAKRKFQEINQARDRIYQQRGMK